ncbi:MAG: sugar ABC transporter permease [Anaerolineae bacterium]|nr:sugar ABC transporter permease [Anaerolineae bacterium]NUQ03373.1 sugar ABC transporter permease [Anaerolineae bacterium]
MAVSQAGLKQARLVTRTRGRLNASRREALWFYLIISPWLVGLLLLLAGPMLYSIYLSFTDWNLFNAPEWVGFDNYIRLFTRDRTFGYALGNTFYYTFLYVPLNIVLSLGIAYLLNKRLPGIRLFRTVIYLPYVVPVVATTMVFRWVFAPDNGLLNSFLALLGIDGPAWLLTPEWVKIALVIMSLWGVGSSVVFLLAGMQGIPAELYEAAAIDGASERQHFFGITLPMLSPVIFFNMIMSIIASLQTFTQVYILNAEPNTPGNAIVMIIPYLFDNAFRFNKMGYASAIAWVLFVIIFAFTLLVIRSSSAWVFYENEMKR